MSQRVACHLGEGSLHVDVILGRGLKVRHAPFRLCPCFSLLLGYHSRVAAIHVNLVAQSHEGEVVWVLRVRLYQELVAPVVQILKGLCVVDVVHEYATVCTPVERNSQGLEALLSCCVPNLHCHCLVIHLYLLGQEISPNGGLVLLGELPLHVLVHQTGLAHATVPQDDDLQQAPVSPLAWHDYFLFFRSTKPDKGAACLCW
mmetsp:Transcript_19291/g.54011  ORF Transcript_19291/g.54011 Transcript_19291/m.54011 type:complete len:202 (-) Transcript_19291:22-627(-)